MNSISENFQPEIASLEDAEAVSRLRTVIESVGGYSTIVDKAGISSSTLSNYLNGREMKVSVARKIASVAGVDPAWLIFGGRAPSELGTKQLVASDNSKPEDRVSVRLVNVEASAGHGRSPSNIEEYAYVDLIRSNLPPYVLSRLNHLVGVTVRGDSMQPTLYDNDTIFVDIEDTDIIPGCVYVLRRDTDFMVKRLTWTIMGDLVVSSDNARYPSETIDAKRAKSLFEAGGSPVQIMGRVLYKTGTIGSL